jgi:type VI secretion system protein ImpA
MPKANRKLNPSLEYDDRFTALEGLWAAYDDESADEAAVEAVAPNWFDCIERTQALLRESADLRLGIWLLRAELHAHGLSCAPSAIARIDDILSAYPDTAQPIAEEGHPGSGYALALAWLGSAACIRELLAVPLFTGSDASLRDLAKDQHLIGRLTPVQVKALEEPGADPSDRWSGALESLLRIETAANRYAEGFTLSTTALRDLLAKVVQLIKLSAQSSPATPNGVAEVHAATPADGHTGEARLTSRAQVHEQIEAAIAYFELHEPGHPAPILLRRAQKTMGMDFASIIAELLPEARTALDKISGN